MHDFCYVARKSAAPLKAELNEIINQVQDLVRENLLFNILLLVAPAEI